MCSHTNEPRPRRTRLMLALSLAVLPLAGCACEDMDWLAIVAADAEAAVLHTAPDCRIGSLARLSKTSATLAGRADPALLDAALSLSGGRFVLPPGTAVIGLRRTRAGAELKLELLVVCLPVDALAITNRLLTARPASAAAFRRWCGALAGAPLGSAPRPGAVNVVSVRVGPGTGPELNVYLRPAALTWLCRTGVIR